MLKIIKALIKAILFPIVFLLSAFFYNKIIYHSKYFFGRKLFFLCIGWSWVIPDVYGKLFLGINRNTPYPVSPRSTIINGYNIIFDPDDLHNFQSPGCYFQAIGDAKIYIGRGTLIGPNVGLITTNHDIHNIKEHEKGSDIIIGDYCWLGCNSVILPGVMLPNRTIIGAGSIVTHSFHDENCIIAGNPAKVIRKVEG